MQDTVFSAAGNPWSARPFFVLESALILIFHDSIVWTDVLLTFTFFAIWRIEKFKLLKVTIWARFSVLRDVFLPIFSTYEFTLFGLECVLASTFLNWKWKDIAIQILQ